MNHQQFLSRLSQKNDQRLMLLVLDGVGDIRTADQPRTALELAATPHLDALAKRSALGRLVPVLQGVTPGSGPGHLALFGYDPTAPETDIGRGVLEALGLGLELRPDDVVARGNFATADSNGLLTDRRAGRPTNEESKAVCDILRSAVTDIEDVEVQIHAGEGHRFVLVLRGSGLSAELADTDPQKTAVKPLAPKPLASAARNEEAKATAAIVGKVIERFERALADQPAMNRGLLRGFSQLPKIPSLGDLYKLRSGAFAGYPLYRGVASACGMKVASVGKKFSDLLPVVQQHWDDFDYFFLHVKQTDMAGEDGNIDTKVAVLEEVDRHLPELLALGPDVLAITGDHSTPAPMSAHSWHPVPLLIASDLCGGDDTEAFTEMTAIHGQIGTLPAHELIGLMLANGGKLAKFGA